jgi:CRISPR/Cas system-associated protein Cas10 (large subunit of type III CRISPR-Cas system)
MSDLRNWVCEHGSLRRKCEICERDERIKELERERDEAMGWCQVAADQLESGGERYPVIKILRNAARAAGKGEEER